MSKKQIQEMEADIAAEEAKLGAVEDDRAKLEEKKYKVYAMKRDAREKEIQEVRQVRLGFASLSKDPKHTYRVTVEQFEVGKPQPKEIVRIKASKATDKNVVRTMTSALQEQENLLQRKLNEFNAEPGHKLYANRWSQEQMQTV